MTDQQPKRKRKCAVGNSAITDAIRSLPLRRSEAALWFIGQAGYVARCGDKTLAIDPYLTDSAGRASPDFARIHPTPVEPEDLCVDLFLVTHDHLDHLDPETVKRYRHKKTTLFVAPRLACQKLEKLHVPSANIRRLDSGERLQLPGVEISAVYAVPTEPRAIDTEGFHIRFANGRSFYHTSDTSFSPLLLAAAPRAELLLVCINGKWGNLGIDDAIRLANHLRPRTAIPNHYDIMRFNSEEPEAFRVRMRMECPGVPVSILTVMEPYVWGDARKTRPARS
jgi:L-ascorbate 6-phosphate lactonase